LLQAFGHEAAVLERRFAAHARACVFQEGRELLAYVWFQGLCHDEEDLGIRFELGPDEIWLFDAMVKTDRRGHGLYSRLLRAAARDLGREDVRRILIAIEGANRNSLRAHEAAGAQPRGTVCVFRVLGLTFVRHAGGFRAAWTGIHGYVRLSTSNIV
jgi:hypothetical protein